MANGTNARTRDAAELRLDTLRAADLQASIQELSVLLKEAVDSGASLGFMPPLSQDEAQCYWRSLLPQLQSGSRLLVAAYYEERIVASGQLSLPPWRNGRHRASIEKLFVRATLQRQGIGSSVIAELETCARGLGRSLLLINARRGDRAENLYKRLGYSEFGAIPGYSIGPGGERYDNVCMYRQLAM